LEWKGKFSEITGRTLIPSEENLEKARNDAPSHCRIKYYNSIKSFMYGLYTIEGDMKLLLNLKKISPINIYY